MFIEALYLCTVHGNSPGDCRKTKQGTHRQWDIIQLLKNGESAGYNADKLEDIIHLRNCWVSKAGQMAEVPINISKWAWSPGSSSIPQSPPVTGTALLSYPTHYPELSSPRPRFPFPQILFPI